MVKYSCGKCGRSFPTYSEAKEHENILIGEFNPNHFALKGGEFFLLFTGGGVDFDHQRKYVREFFSRDGDKLRRLLINKTNHSRLQALLDSGDITPLTKEELDFFNNSLEYLYSGLPCFPFQTLE